MDGIKSFIENLLDTYEKRVAVISQAMRATADNLRDLSKEQAEMALQLRDTLAKKTSFRRKDFDSFLQDVVIQNLDREKEITKALEDLQKEEESMIARLRDILTGKENVKLVEFKLISKDLIERLSQREKKAADMLRWFHIEQEELTRGLRKLIDKEDIRIKDFKVMVESIKLRQQERDSDVGRMLEDLEEVQQQINWQWEDLRKSYLIS
ncbi:MAG: hypothetical protein SCARUB_00559 [Candidatus Scalindua rubra]|uniref:Uncharacterized protein n=1 Tax=Candidatus Scalindua rubra TaxID=1872076 RepID=A0A1E3XFD5_9BACT|nr:MAG: hypothetical protein SCARUB_00559 [Candidatus Scalindua rubra]